MIPLRKPRDSRMKLLASARYIATCRTAVIEQARRTNVIRIKLEGSSQRVMMPYMVALQIYSMQRGFCEPELSLNQGMTMDHARKVCTYMQRKRIWIRVQHMRLDGERDMWGHEMIGLA